MKNRRLKGVILSAAVSALCFAAYVATAVIFMRGAFSPAENSVQSVPYDRPSGRFFILCEYSWSEKCAAVDIDLDAGNITLTLFESKSAADSYGFEYSRGLKITRTAAVDLIGRIGGIVIRGENGYNINNKPVRVMGSEALALAEESAEKREMISLEFMNALLEYDLSKEDFLFIAENCETNISYADYCRYWQAVRTLSGKINVVTG